MPGKRGEFGTPFAAFILTLGAGMTFDIFDVWFYDPDYDDEYPDEWPVVFRAHDRMAP